MVRATLAFLAFTLAATSQAAITTSITSSPSFGLAGYSTYAITATTTADEKIIGFDFGSGSYGITGPMNQINPAGNSTVFYAFDGFVPFIPSFPEDDSHFKVLTSRGSALNAAESADSLKGTFTYNAASIPTVASNVWSFVQISTNNPTAVNYFGTLTVQDAAGQSRLETIQGTLVPEPVAVEPLSMIVAASLANFRRREVKLLGP
jgi:hypothetical protein